MLISRIVKKLKKIVNNFNNKIILKKNKIINRSFNIRGVISIVNNGRISIGSGFMCNSGSEYNPIGGDTICRFIVRKSGKLIIGRNVGISNSTLVCSNSITIGDNVFIGGSCKIWDTDFHSINPKTRISGYDNNVLTGPIIIKECAFIGGSSIVLKGVTIGRNSIIAAGSIVSKNIPDNEIWGGNPVKFIRRLTQNELS